MSLSSSLDLTIVGAKEPKPDGGACFPSWVVARLNNHAAILELPQDGTIGRLLEKRELIVQSLTNTATIPQSDLEDFSRSLGGVLINGAIGPLYGEGRTGGIRINLLINDCDLQLIPWEYMCGPGDMPIPDVERSIARIVPCRSIPVKNQGRETLRVLLAVSREPNDGNVPIDEMRAVLERKFKLRMPRNKVELVVCSASNRQDFSNAVTEADDNWDVIHFLGHGEVQTGSSQSIGMLRLADDTGTVEHMSSMQFATMVAAAKTRLVVLTACNSGEAAVAAPFSNIAFTTVSMGVPAAVANQMAVPADTVAEFCGGVYDSLLQNGDIDLAVSSGRQRSFTTLARGDVDNAAVEWGIPILYRAPGAEILFPEFAA